jgi:hypothetical protein
MVELSPATKKHHKPSNGLEGQGLFSDLLRSHQRLIATKDHTASTIPNGHAPCKKPYTEAITQDTANASTNQAERPSMA